MKAAVLLLASGCLGATTPLDTPTLDLTINVSTQQDELFTLVGGTMATQATFTKEYATPDDRPGAVLLPVTIAATKVVVPLDVSCSAEGLASQHVQYLSLGKIDAFGVAGVYIWDCSYHDDHVSQGQKDLAVAFNPSDSPPAL